MHHLLLICKRLLSTVRNIAPETSLTDNSSYSGQLEDNRNYFIEKYICTVLNEAVKTCNYLANSKYINGLILSGIWDKTAVMVPVTIPNYYT